MDDSSHVVLGRKFPHFHADALFRLGQEEAPWEYPVELVLRACEEPEPPECLLGLGANGRVSLQA